MTTMFETIQMRRGTAAAAASNNRVLAAGEIGVELDTLKVKVGNGTDAWNDLPYVSDAAPADPNILTPSGGDDTAAIQAALSSSPWGYAILGPGTFKISGAGGFIIGDGKGMRGAGGDASNPKTTIQIIDSTGWVEVQGGGPMCSGFFIDGSLCSNNQAAMLRSGGTHGSYRTFIDVSVAGGTASDGLRCNSAQNDKWFNTAVSCISSTNSALILDHGYGGSKWYGTEFKASSCKYVIDVQKNLTIGVDVYTVPTDNHFFGGLCESTGPTITSLLHVNAAIRLVFYGTVFYAGALPSTNYLINIESSTSAFDIGFNNLYMQAGSAPGPLTGSVGLHVGAFSKAHITGTSEWYNLDKCVMPEAIGLIDLKDTPIMIHCGSRLGLASGVTDANAWAYDIKQDMAAHTRPNSTDLVMTSDNGSTGRYWSLRADGRMQYTDGSTFAADTFTQRRAAGVWGVNSGATAALATGVGPTSSRPPASTAIAGAFRINSDTSKLEFTVDGTNWIAAAGAGGLPNSMTGLGTYHPQLNLYTPPNAYPTKTRAKLGQVVAGSGAAKVAFIGASMTAGYNGASSVRGSGDIPFLFNSVLASIGYPAGEPAAVFDDFIASDLRQSVTGVWSHTTQPAAANYATAPAGGTATVTSSRETDSLLITFPGTSSSFTVTIDGAIPASATMVHSSYTAGTGTVTPDGTSNIASMTVTGLKKIPHSVLITTTAGTILYLVEFYLSNSLRTANWGQSSSQTTHWANTSTFNTELNQVINWAPDLVVIGLDMAANDWDASVSLSTTATNLNTIVSALQAAGIEVMLISPPPFLETFDSQPPPTPFWQTFYTLADTYGCWLTDNYARWVSRANAFALGMYGSDNFHPSAAGYRDLVRSFTGSFGQQVTDPWNPTSQQNLASGSAATIPNTVTQGGTYLLKLTANCAITMPTPFAGAKFTFGLQQDATGSRTVTSWTTVDWGSAPAPTLSTAAGKIDAITFVCLDGSTWLGFLAGTAF